MTLDKGLAVQQGHERHACQVHRRTEVLQRGRTDHLDGHACILSLSYDNPGPPETDHTHQRDKREDNTLSNCTYPPKYCPMSASLSPVRRGLSRVWVRSSTASFTSTSMCSARSPVLGAHRALCSWGNRPLRRRRTLRTVSPSWRGS